MMASAQRPAGLPAGWVLNTVFYDLYLARYTILNHNGANNHAKREDFPLKTHAGKDVDKGRDVAPQKGAALKRT
jgi:hypothetical protein